MTRIGRRAAQPLLASFIMLASSCGESSGAGEGAGSGSEPPPGTVSDPEGLFGSAVQENDLSGGLSEASTCLGEIREAEAMDLDLFLMIDTSASMLDPLPDSPNPLLPLRKWDAVQSSLRAFLADGETADIGVGLQYFPQLVDGVPNECSQNSECGAGGPCSNSICLTTFVGGDLAFRSITSVPDAPCGSDAECLQGEQCAPVVGFCVAPPADGEPAGVPVFDTDFGGLRPLCGSQSDCSGLPDTVCEAVGLCPGAPDLQCTTSLPCPPGTGSCTVLPARCVGQTRCEPGDYSEPAVAIRTDADRSIAIIDSLRSRVPEGLTPTGPALEGALLHAQRWSSDNPGRQTVTVLVTDGLPTECSPTETSQIAEIARAARDGDTSVRTFVIGVFSAFDLQPDADGIDGQERLDELARAGGSERAVIIDTDEDVATQLLNALSDIRDTAVSCEFRLQANEALDFDRVNLLVGPTADARTQLPNVAGPGACGDQPGWYYVRGEDDIPQQLNVCPATCRNLRAGDLQAELQVGCATIIR